MAVYYIKPHTTVNGTGTFASPFSFNSTSRGAFTSSDELRVVSIPTTSLFTATTYTATYTSSYQLTVTSGGGLGADFAANNVVYIVETDCFFRVASVSTNVLALSGTNVSFMPVNNTTAGGTFTLRRVDLTANGVSAASSTMQLLGAVAASGATVTDGWTADGVQTTDGSAKTVLFTTVAGAGGLTLIASAASADNCTINLPWTYVVGGLVGTSTSTKLYGEILNNSTITLGQVYSPYASNANSGMLVLGLAATPVGNNTFNIRTLTNISLYSATCYCSSLTVNITNFQAGYFDSILYGAGASTSGTTVNNVVLNLGNITGYNAVGAGVIVFPSYGTGTHTITITGTYDMYLANTRYGVGNNFASAGTTITLGPSFVMKYTQRGFTQTAIDYPNYLGTTTQNRTLSSMYSAKIINNSAVTFNNAYDNTLNPLSNPNAERAGSIIPEQYVVCASSVNMSSGLQYGVAWANMLYIGYDNSTPAEICGTDSGWFNASTGVWPNLLALVTLDSSTFRTTGPSLKATLATRQNGYWGATATTKAYARKWIRVPCTAGVAKTVAGYFRYSGFAGFTNGDARLSIYLNGVEIVGQDMTTAASGAWEAFSLSFTPAATAEYRLVWKMTFASAGSMWIDDLST